MNADKCKLLVTNYKVHAEIENEIIENKKSVKLLEVIIDHTLSFEEHILKICKKVSLKLHALSRMSHFLSTYKLKVLTS